MPVQPRRSQTHTKKPMLRPLTYNAMSRLLSNFADERYTEVSMLCRPSLLLVRGNVGPRRSSVSQLRFHHDIVSIRPLLPSLIRKTLMRKSKSKHRRSRNSFADSAAGEQADVHLEPWLRKAGSPVEKQTRKKVVRALTKSRAKPSTDNAGLTAMLVLPAAGFVPMRDTGSKREVLWEHRGGKLLGSSSVMSDIVKSRSRPSSASTTRCSSRPQTAIPTNRVLESANAARRALVGPASYVQPAGIFAAAPRLRPASGNDAARRPRPSSSRARPIHEFELQSADFPRLHFLGSPHPWRPSSAPPARQRGT